MCIVGCVIILLGLSFYAGVLWKSKTLGVAPKYELQTPIEIQVSSTQLGKIPAGAILYKYLSVSDTTTYYLFLNLKERTILQPYRGEEKYNLVIPIYAYSDPK